MPSNPPTVADLEAEVSILCGIALAEAGVYLRAADSGGIPFTPVIRIGLRKGAKCVGLYLPNPLVLMDADIAFLSPYALERVLTEGQLFALRQAHAHWHRAVQKYGEAPLLPAPMTGGWLMEEKRNLEKTISELKAICDEPFREPTGDLTVRTPTLPFQLNPTSTTAPAGTEPDRFYPSGWGDGYGWYGF